MGFFLSPRSRKKKKVVLDQLVSSSSSQPTRSTNNNNGADNGGGGGGSSTTNNPDVAVVPPTVSGLQPSSSNTMAPPPLFNNTNTNSSSISRRQLLKHLKGTGHSQVRRNSIHGVVVDGGNNSTSAIDSGNNSSRMMKMMMSSSPVKSFHQSFSIGSPSRIRALPLSGTMSPTTDTAAAAATVRKTYPNHPDDNDVLQLSPSTSNASLSSLLKSPTTTTTTTVDVHRKSGDDDGTPPSKQEKGRVQQPKQQHLREAGQTSSIEQLLSPPLHQSTSALSAEGSMVSYIEEVILEDDEEGGDFEEEYEYIEEIVLSSTTDDDGRKRLVKFDEFDEVQMTIHMNDFTTKEVQNYWFCRTDYDGMIESARSVVQKEEERRRQQQQEQQQLQEGMIQQEASATTKPNPASMITKEESNGVTEFETRGLEAWSDSGKEDIRQVKEAAIEAVWDEQHRQWDVGVVDWNSMKDAYQRVSLEAQRIATERGLSDQIIAERIRQLEQIGAGPGSIIDGVDPAERHKRRLKKTTTRITGTTKRGSLLAKSKSLFRSIRAQNGRQQQQQQDDDDVPSTSTTTTTTSRRLLLTSISRTASKRALQRQQQRTIYKQPSASARALMDAGALSISSGSKSEQNMKLQSSTRTKILEEVASLMGSHKANNMRGRRSSGWATWEQEAGLIAGGKL